MQEPGASRRPLAEDRAAQRPGPSWLYTPFAETRLGDHLRRELADARPRGREELLQDGNLAGVGLGLVASLEVAEHLDHEAVAHLPAREQPIGELRRAAERSVDVGPCQLAARIDRKAGLAVAETPERVHHFEAEPDGVHQLVARATSGV